MHTKDAQEATSYLIKLTKKLKQMYEICDLTSGTKVYKCLHIYYQQSAK